jgi:pimeloyl-ACP methyl ester carboxylesterase
MPRPSPHSSACGSSIVRRWWRTTSADSSRSEPTSSRAQRTIPPSGSPFFRFVQSNPGLLAQLPAYIHEAIVRAYVANASHRGLDADELDALVEPWTGELGQAGFYRQIADYDLALLEDNERQLGELDLPVRILWGAEDTWIPPEIGRRFAGLVPGASLVEVPSAGHLLQYDAPVALATALRAWLTAGA